MTPEQFMHLEPEVTDYAERRMQLSYSVPIFYSRNGCSICKAKKCNKLLKNKTAIQRKHYLVELFFVRKKYHNMGLLSKEGFRSGDVRSQKEIFYSKEYQELLKKKSPMMYIQVWKRQFDYNPSKFIEKTGLKETRWIKRKIAVAVKKRLM